MDDPHIHLIYNYYSWLTKPGRVVVRTGSRECLPKIPTPKITLGTPPVEYVPDAEASLGGQAVSTSRDRTI